MSGGTVEVAYDSKGGFCDQGMVGVYYRSMDLTMARHFKIWLAVVALIGSSAATASTYACVGTIDFVSVSPTGVVTVNSQSSGLGVLFVCQMGTTVNGVSADACKGILSLLLEAKAIGAQVGWWFNDSIGCSRTAYFGGNWYWLSDPAGNWYYGPQMQ